jgi:8-oxo-dGTP pyrophosphatase MutT (NUDIX family)
LVSDTFPEDFDLRVDTAGVGVCIGTRDGFLLGLRSPEALRNPGVVSLITGHVDRKSVSPDTGKIDVKKAAELEVEEEIGITAKKLPLQLTGIMRHLNGRSYDVIYDGYINKSLTEILAKQAGAVDAAEHSRLVVVPYENVKRNLNSQLIAPVLWNIMRHVLKERALPAGKPIASQASVSNDNLFKDCLKTG